MPKGTDAFERKCEEVRGCELCKAALSPHPVVVGNQQARILIIGQAPGRKVHDTGIPWNDPSGDRLREWLQVSRAQFYDSSLFAIVPMGLCYPGKGKSGDLPPRKECAPRWHPELLPLLPNIQLTLLIGQYAQQHYLSHKPRTLTETVENWQHFAPAYFPLPHPSPRNTLWLKRHPWFEQETLPALRTRLAKCLQ
uniref:uracil-DNA glycosylase family protein n=1 Tax=Thaumasiovibrio occultus TaxID=1891184 RepID=UPI000B354B3B|nr:uracil-DNA glycosylase family protein [Thaumasiovibrio occultus]